MTDKPDTPSKTEASFLARQSDDELREMAATLTERAKQLRERAETTAMRVVKIEEELLYREHGIRPGDEIEIDGRPHKFVRFSTLCGFYGDLIVRRRYVTGRLSEVPHRVSSTKPWRKVNAGEEDKP